MNFLITTFLNSLKYSHYVKCITRIYFQVCFTSHNNIKKLFSILFKGVAYSFKDISKREPPDPLVCIQIRQKSLRMFVNIAYYNYITVTHD
jgi:hypothetical protein